MMMKRLACLMFGVAIAAACSPGSGGAPQGAADQQGGAQPGSAAQLAPPKVQLREVIIPAGMTMSLALETAVSSDQSRVEDTVRAKLTKPIVIEGRTAVPEGAEVIGSVVEATQAGRVQGVALISFRFDRLRLGEDTYTIRTARIAREARTTKGEDARTVGIGAGAGAIVGAIAGGQKGAAVGAAVGAGAGGGVVMSTRGDEVRLGPGTVVTTRVDEPIKIQVPVE